RQRVRLIALRNAGFSVTVSALALIMRRPIFGSDAQCGTRPQRITRTCRCASCSPSESTLSTGLVGAMLKSTPAAAPPVASSAANSAAISRAPLPRAYLPHIPAPSLEPGSRGSMVTSSRTTRKAPSAPNGETSWADAGSLQYDSALARSCGIRRGTCDGHRARLQVDHQPGAGARRAGRWSFGAAPPTAQQGHRADGRCPARPGLRHHHRSEEHTSELQSRENLVCRLLLEKKNEAKAR